MKPLKALGILAGILATCGMLAYASSTISHRGDPAHANAQAVPKANVPKAPSSIQSKAESMMNSAAVASAQEATGLPQ